MRSPRKPPRPPERPPPPPPLRRLPPNDLRGPPENPPRENPAPPPVEGRLGELLNERPPVDGRAEKLDPPAAGRGLENERDGELENERFAPERGPDEGRALGRPDAGRAERRDSCI